MTRVRDQLSIEVRPAAVAVSSVLLELDVLTGGVL